MDTTEVTRALGAIVVFGVGAQWLGRRTGFPSIVLLLLAGIIAGPVTGLVDLEALFGDTLDPQSRWLWPSCSSTPASTWSSGSSPTGAPWSTSWSRSGC